MSAYPLWGPHLNPVLAFEGYGRVMAVLVPVIAIPVILYGASASREDKGWPRLLTLLVVFTGFMELLVSAGDFLSLLIAWELVGACSWALIAYEWRDRANLRAALAAYLTTRIGDLGLYVAASALFVATGSLRFTALAALHGPALALVAAGVVFAAAAKSAQLPFSPWLFSAMRGPTVSSALLHSATMVAAGAYLLIRLQPYFTSVAWFAPLVATLGVATALAGGLVAMSQSDLKKALAGSTSAQYGFMFLAIAAGVPGAAGIHLVTHAAFKALLFLGAGTVMHAAGTLDLAIISPQRLGRLLPRAAVLFAIGALALAAVPPLGGAFSKEQIVAAATQATHGAVPLTVGVLVAGLLSGFYALRLQLLAFGVPGVHSRGDESTVAHRPSTMELASIGALAAITIALGALWLPAVADIAERFTGVFAMSAWWELLASLVALALGIGAAWMMWRRGVLLTLGVPDAARFFVAGWFGLPAAANRMVVEPALRVSHSLARLDEIVVDAGIRAAVRVAAGLSAAAWWWGERGIAGSIGAIADGTTSVAVLSRWTDDHALDGAVEGIASGVGAAGARSRALQTGLTHDYYAAAAAGVLVLIVAAAGAVLWLRYF